MPTFYVMYNGIEPYEGDTVPADKIKEFTFIAFRGSNGKCMITNKNIKSYQPDTRLYPVSGSADGIHTIRDLNNMVAPTPESYAELVAEYTLLISEYIDPTTPPIV